MILIGIGGNLHSAQHGPPRATLAAALAALPGQGIAVAARSGWYRTEPVPRSDQPWFVNAVALLTTALAPATVLARLQAVEAAFGRVRSVANAARVLDLDLLDHDGAVVATPDLVLPHPRLHLRRFVLMPLAELAPQWRHPVLAATAAELLAGLPPDSPVHRLAD